MIVFATTPLAILTVLIIIFGACFIGLLDYALYRYRGNDATFSKVILSTSLTVRWFSLVFMFGLGILVGHLLIPQVLYLPAPAPAAVRPQEPPR